MNTADPIKKLQISQTIKNYLNSDSDKKTELLLMFSLFVYVPCGVGEAGMSQGLAVGSNGGFLGARESLNVGWKIIGRNNFEINVVASDFLIRYTRVRLVI